MTLPPYGPVACTPKRVLILAYCGHRRHVLAPAPMDAWQRGIENGASPARSVDDD